MTPTPNQAPTQLISVADIIAWKQALGKGSTVGFVPTMGALHEGHLALIQSAMQHCDVVVASIYINPTQFNLSADFSAYPSDVEGDIAMLHSVGCHAVFLPETDLLYPHGVAPDHFDLAGLDGLLEGVHRPGHFQGVATVVNRLFDLLMPDKAFFGLKDFQQVKVVQQLATIRDSNPEIIPCPIVREPSGLAMSSRNRRLTPDQCADASVIFIALQAIADSQGSLSPVEIQSQMTGAIQASGALIVEAIDVVCADDLTCPDPMIPLRNHDKKVQVMVSAFAGEVRLIDNLTVYTG
ncbi:MAG: pantoate--beta-alanine ligase [Bacteroidetes bacterium]|nr:pantoate--beta-alanine ligase [Bacteroidota bacterium]